MIIQISIRLLLCILTAAIVQGCANKTDLHIPNVNAIEQTLNQDDLESVYSRLVKTDGKVFKIEPGLSSIRIYAFRGGAAPALGHNHVLTTSQFSGFVYLFGTDQSKARVDFEFRLDSLEIDNPIDRLNLGESFASMPAADAIKRTRDHMLGEENLQADRFPFVRVHTLRIDGEIPKLAMEVQIELHGQKQKFWVPLNVEGLPDKLIAKGAFVIRQSDFGIKPYSVLGGFLAVQDALVIEFSLVGK